jgi:cold shock protein
MTGTIKRLMDKGYGFIASDELDKDVFFHSSELVEVEFNDLREGTAVTFEVKETDKGMNAVQVSLA